MPYKRTHKDSQGRELEVGQKVAYNMSGSVVPGEIANLGNEIRIRYTGNQKFYDYDWDAGFISGQGYKRTEKIQPKISRVRNGTSVLTLEDTPCGL